MYIHIDTYGEYVVTSRIFTPKSNVYDMRYF